jgi:hypothetical protein
VGIVLATTFDSSTATTVTTVGAPPPCPNEVDGNTGSSKNLHYVQSLVTIIGTVVLHYLILIVRAPIPARIEKVGLKL